MHIKLLALLLVGSALSGCCASGTGCSAPTATGAPIAWDGLGEPPTADGEQAGAAKPKRRTAARNRDREIILGPLNETAPRSDTKARYDEWTRLPNEDPEADAKLKRQIKICQNC